MLNQIVIFVKNKLLLFVVFLTGACVLILEVLATRILSPYFGNTIYTVSSVIGVVLAALSLGYHFGGNFADKYPKKLYFYSIILLSGFATFLMQIIISLILPTWGYKLPITYGPLVTSIFLFSVPSFLLGLLSPYAIKLQEVQFPKTGVGKLSGQVFFYSTLGSIIGTFLAGFYLIPRFGLHLIVIGVGSVLVIIGLFGVLGNRDLKKKSLNTLLLIAITSFLFITSTFKYANNNNIVYSKDGIYEKITVLDTKYKDKDSRILIQDRSSSSAIFHEDPEALAFEYTKYIDVYKLFMDKPKRALFIGGGAYSMPSYLIRNVPNISVDVTEIEPDLYEISKRYFSVKDNPNLKNHVTDGRRFLKDNKTNYDIIFSDVYSTIYSIPPHFTTSEFFQLAKDNLSENGIFVANIIGDLSRRAPSLTISEITTFKKVFPNSYFIAVDSPTNRAVQNLIFLGVKSNKPINFEDLEKKFPTDVILSKLKEKLINLDRFNFLNYPVITDNYSPVENITKSMITRNSENLNKFSGAEALSIINQLVSYDSRHVGSSGHDNALKMIMSEVQAYDKNFIEDIWDENIRDKNYKMTNLVLKMFPEKTNRIILGSHFDSLYENPGANNSASGVSVLMEIMRVLKNSPEQPNMGVDFVFFDGEEGIPGNDWKAYGSEFFAKNINNIYKTEKPKSAIILDMVCDKDLNIYYEKNSLNKASLETYKLFDIANNLYPDSFHKETKYSINDDHTALNNIGIPSVLLIDFDYKYYNTNNDTQDKCSAESLDKVGASILKYIYSL